MVSTSMNIISFLFCVNVCLCLFGKGFLFLKLRATASSFFFLSFCLSCLICWLGFVPLFVFQFCICSVPFWYFCLFLPVVCNSFFCIFCLLYVLALLLRSLSTYHIHFIKILPVCLSLVPLYIHPSLFIYISLFTPYFYIYLFKPSLSLYLFIYTLSIFIYISLSTPSISLHISLFSIFISFFIYTIFIFISLFALSLSWYLILYSHPSLSLYLFHFFSLS